MAFFYGNSDQGNSFHYYIHTCCCYSNSCYGDIDTIEIVIVARVTHILLLSNCCYGDIFAFAIVKYVCCFFLWFTRFLGLYDFVGMMLLRFENF